MKKFVLTVIALFIVALTPRVVLAQGMPAPSGVEGMGNWLGDAAIQKQQQEEQEGKKLLNELKNKTITCQKLTSDNFEKIGEYFMGQMIGDTSRHIAMNNMMQSMMGQTGEEQAHIAMGKRMSGCDPNAAMSPNMMNGAMMSMIMGGGDNPMMGYGGWNNMMGGGSFGLLGWIPMVIFWVLIILVVVALIRYLNGGNAKNSQVPLEFLKERYAKGEITKKEFEERKKDLR